MLTILLRESQPRYDEVGLRAGMRASVLVVQVRVGCCWFTVRAAMVQDRF